MKKRGSWNNNKNDYHCICGQVLINTCESMVKKHLKTKKHMEKLKKKDEIKEPIITKIKFEKKNITVTFD